MKKIFKITSGKRTLMYALTALAILMAGCRGKEGPMGPTGNANVVSAQYEVKSSDWSGDINGYNATLPVPEITSDIVNNGAVLVYYLKLDLNNNISAFNLLPYTYVDNTSIEYMDYDASLGQIVISFKWVDNGINNTSAPTTMDFKVVIIQGMSLTAIKEKVNITNYNAVASYFKLDNSKNLVK